MMQAAWRVRRVRADEWEAVRELRLAALQDPDAGIAFLESHESAAGRSEWYWRTRTTDAADSEAVAQLVAEDADGWAGSATVMVHPAGSRDYTGRIRLAPAAVVVGVYVRPRARGTGAIDALLEAASAFARERGLDVVALDTHEDNVRAQAAYRRAGFRPTGDSFVGPNGRELQFRRAI